MPNNFTFLVLVSAALCSGAASAQSASGKPTPGKPGIEKWAADGRTTPDKAGIAKPAPEMHERERPATEKSASDRLTQIETETLLLKAREKQIEVQANILTRQNEIALRQAANAQLTNKAATGEPQVRAIEGIGKSMYATIQLSNGNLVEAKSGDTLSNGMKVVSVKPNEVIVQSPNRQRVRLGGALPTAVQGDFNPDYPGPGVSVPALPMPAPRGTSR